MDVSICKKGLNVCVSKYWNCTAKLLQYIVLKINLIKNHLRSIMKDDRLSALSIKNIEAKVLKMIEFDDIINTMRTLYECTCMIIYYHSCLIFIKIALFHYLFFILAFSIVLLDFVFSSLSYYLVFFWLLQRCLCECRSA